MKRGHIFYFLGKEIEIDIEPTDKVERIKVKQKSSYTSAFESYGSVSFDTDPNLGSVGGVKKRTFNNYFMFK